MAPLVGRAKELSHIGHLIDGVRDGGSALLVRGEAGSGEWSISAVDIDAAPREFRASYEQAVPPLPVEQ